MDMDSNNPYFLFWSRHFKKHEIQKIIGKGVASLVLCIIWLENNYSILVVIYIGGQFGKNMISDKREKEKSLRKTVIE